MARTELDRAVRASLLDRLTDLEPREPSDRNITREESASAFRRSVQRDVEALLNSRRTIVPVPAGCNEVLHSAHEYGLGAIPRACRWARLKGAIASPRTFASRCCVSSRGCST
jgi:predicted component of type VI protein secretion system